MARVKILGISGSLRHDSYNTATLHAAQELTPEEAVIETFDRLGDIPPFNQDQEHSPPEPVADLKQRVREADAILFVTPEYNYSVPGVLKNAIDWASRPYGDNVWAGKPVAVMGASISALGTARAQYHLRQSFVFLDMHPVNQPEVMISNASQRFDGGELTDEMSRRLVGDLLDNLVAWTRQLQKAA
jgi:chromate reductase, NAD(P)H dehydrogenase (quinone)